MVHRTHLEVGTHKSAALGAGEPLTDEERRPWLAAVRDEIARAVAGGNSASLVVACSALKEEYRDTLRSANGADVRFAYLEGSRETLINRLAGRAEHFMKAGMAESQLAALEPPMCNNSITINIDDGEAPGIIAQQIVCSLQASAAASLSLSHCGVT